VESPDHRYAPGVTKYALFETAIGWTGIAWGDNGLIGAHLPERDQTVARASLLRRFPGVATAEPPPDVASVMDGIRALLRGEKPTLHEAQLDLARVPQFNARVYTITRQIPPGETMTYGAIALKIGDRHLAQAIGGVLGRNPWPIIVPCHRVTAAGGKLGGFTARGGTRTKLKLLAIEGAPAGAQPDLFGSD
jgi:methylated-DNA-[protein]-cysteine S-methyltransferase